MGSAGASESSSGSSAGDALPTTSASASDSQGPDGSASNSESDSNSTADNSASAGDLSATDAASASDGSAGTTGPPGDSSAGSSDGASTTGASTAGGTDPSGAGEGSAPETRGDIECVPEACNGQIFECGDCEDNDNDGQEDCVDPDCFGPCDDSESVLGSPIEEKDPCKQDCYFDGDGGQGGADCQWNIKCDPKQPDPVYCPHNGWNFDLDENGVVDYAKCVDGDPATCKDSCTAPPGCDCFGCCMFPDNEARFIGSPDCTLDAPGNCAPCTPMWELCGNQCDDGENCFPNPEPNACPM